jgi:trehalose 6-phosphate phosphatase
MTTPAPAPGAAEAPDAAAEIAMADALGRLATTAVLLVALDFDGTLSPTVDQPMGARMLPEAREALLRLVDLPDTRVALVSGRAITSLAEVAGMPDAVLLVGSHGVEYRIDGSAGIALTPDESATRATIHTVLDEVASGYENVAVEEKPAGFALHTRRATDADTEAANAEAARRVEAEAPDAFSRTGKDVLEFAVRDASKGDGLDRLRAMTGATAVLFAGDDVTDEDGFAVLGPDDFGLKCGPGTTAAAYRVADPAAVAHLLGDLAELRAHLGQS